MRKKIKVTCAYCGKTHLTRNKLKERNYCNTVCFNKHTKVKPIDGYRKCINCLNKFPYRKSLNVRNAYSNKLKQNVGHKNQKYCCFKCAVDYRLKNNNPAKLKSVRKKISEFAKKRGVEHLHTEKAREKQRRSISGEGHWNWQGGITPENKRRRCLKEYRDWRKKVFERDKYTCQICGARSGNGKSVVLNADHIKPWSLYPKLRLDINNGRTLCVDCHKKTDTYMGRVFSYKNSV